jgi:hypothetical protein
VEAPAVEGAEPAAVELRGEPEPVVAAKAAPAAHKAEHKDNAEVVGVAAPASTTLTDGVYDEIRRLRSRVADR